MNCWNYLVMFGLVGLLAAGTAAQPLSLQAAVQVGLAHSPEVQAAERDISVTRAQLAQVQALGHLRISADASYLHLSQTPVMKLPEFDMDLTPLGIPKQLPIDLPALPLLNDNTELSAVNVTLPLYTGGRVQYGKAQVHAGIEALQARADATRRDTAFAVIDAYLRAALAQRVAAVADEAYTTITKHEQQAEALLKQGQVPRYEVIRAQTEVANADRRRLDAHNQADLAVAFLQDTMGAPQTDTLELTTPLRGDEPFTEALASTVAAAWQQSSERRALAARDRMYLTAEKGAQAEKNPTLAVMAAKTLCTSAEPFTTPSYTVGLVAHFPLYDGGQANADAAEQVALRQRNQSDVQRLQDGIALRVRKYYLDLTSARKALTAADEAVDLARESLRLATRRFAEGEGTGVEKSDAILALSLAEINREGAKYQYDIAYYGLQDALGTLLTQFDGQAAK